jgi:hypothetical protein
MTGLGDSRIELGRIHNCVRRRPIPPGFFPKLDSHRTLVASFHTFALSAAKKVTNTTEINVKIWFAKLNARPEFSDDIKRLTRAQVS